MGRAPHCRLRGYRGRGRRCIYVELRLQEQGPSIRAPWSAERTRGTGLDRWTGTPHRGAFTATWWTAQKGDGDTWRVQREVARAKQGPVWNVQGVLEYSQVDRLQEWVGW